jgi:NAD-dependent dihydropyrimidine dehydrogenase PreA subunit
MSFIIGKDCVGCLYGDCVNVCPVDCINGPIIIDGLGKEIKGMSDEEKIGKQMYINPDVCIKCGACIPECPVDAIYRDEKEAIHFNDEESIHKNYEFYGQKFNKKI